MVNEPGSLSSTLNSRFRLLDRPLAIPGKCVICGAVDRPVIDTRWNIDYYGAVYFCVNCLTEVATNMLGLVDRNLLEEAKVSLANSFADYIKINHLKVIPLEQYISWADSINSLHDDLVWDSEYTPISANEKTTPTESTADQDTGRTTKQVIKSSGDKRSTSVPDGDVDGDDLFKL